MKMDTLQRMPSLLRYGSNVLWERSARPRSTRRGAVPPDAESITAEWLTQAICPVDSGARVERVEVVGGHDGSTSRRALEITYNAEGERLSMPRRLFTKSVPRLRQRMSLAASGKLAAETEFYLEVRPRLDVEATFALYAGFEPKTGRSMQIFEDLVLERGVTFLDAFCEVDRPMAESLVKTLATYHGAMWENPLLGQMRSLMTTLEWQSGMNRAIAFEQRCYVGMKRAAHVIGDQLLKSPQALWNAHMRTIAMSSEHPHTLLHNDTHLGNWYLTSDGRMGLSDWCMYNGQWANDYCYAISSALPVETRRAWERGLLDLYLDELEKQGGPRLHKDAAWLAYRQQMLHGFFYWAITIGGGPLQTDMQPDEISLINLERMSHAIIDLETLKALDE
jgi:hypothetical protein